jgi:pSer/pThr/pTyr-binding forkhead associated (FHA) protein
LTGIEFRFHRGSQAGTRVRLAQTVIRIGRHPENDLRFHVELDRDASSRHAEIRLENGRYLLTDLGSTNGTLLNGQRIAEPREVHDGDVIEFGPNGPSVGITLLDAGAPRPEVRRTRSSASVEEEPATVANPRKNTEVRIAEAVRKETGSLRWMLLLLLAVVLVGGAAAVKFTMRSASAGQAAIATLIAANDSLSRLLDARLSQTGVGGAAIREARAEIDRLSTELRSKPQGGADAAALTDRIRASQERTASFARTDYSAILAANKAAVVFIAVELENGEAATGTGFNLLPDGLIVTNRHVVQPTNGQAAKRIAIVFEGTKGDWRFATVESVSPTDELAFLRIIRPGPYPTISGIARDSDKVRLGDPVAILGFPLGNATAGMEGSINTLRPAATLGIGTVSKTLDENIQLDAYAAQGSSGSPVFDARGLVIGVLFGAAGESGGRIVYTVPSSRLVAQLPADARRVVR